MEETKRDFTTMQHLNSQTPTAGDKRTADDILENEKKKMRREECVVCCNDVAVNRFPRSPHRNSNRGKGRHDSDVCFDCWKLHLESEVTNRDHTAIGCPQCEHKLDEREIRKLASNATYQR